MLVASILQSKALGCLNGSRNKIYLSVVSKKDGKRIPIKWDQKASKCCYPNMVVYMKSDQTGSKLKLASKDKKEGLILIKGKIKKTLLF